MIARRKSSTNGRIVGELQKLIAAKGFGSQPPGTPAQWAEQSFRLAKEALVKPDTNIDEGYYRRHITVIDERLALAGVRLAAVLNRILSPVQCTAQVRLFRSQSAYHRIDARALRAGTTQASERDDRSGRRVMPIIVTGSLGSISDQPELRARCRARGPRASQSPARVASWIRPLRRNIHDTSQRLAPIAMRTPISCVRCVTA